MNRSKILNILKYSIIVGVILGIILAFISSYHNKKLSIDNSLQDFTFALDWTPNTNHTGVYVALEKGWYKDEGLNLKILPYSLSTPSDVLVSAGKADAGIGFTEGVVSSSAGDSSVTSIAAIIAKNTSIIATRKSDNITSLSQLDGKTYGGYGAPYEVANMKAAIKHDGGKGEFKNITVDTDPLDALENKRVDFVWVYDGWEGIQAKRRGFEISKFSITEHGIPDYSTPDIIASPNAIKNNPELLQKFMKATAKGYEYARKNPDESAKILIETAPKGTFPDKGLVYESQQYLSQNYQEKGRKWGVQEADFWLNYPKFMLESKLITDVSGKPVSSIDYTALYTNKFLN